MLQEQQLFDGDYSCVHRFLCHYRPKSHGSDDLSLSLLRFKKRLQVDWQAWTECAADVLAPRIENSTLILRALHHNEVRVGESALDALGALIGRKSHGHYKPTSLAKTRGIPSLKHLSQREREDTLRNAYIFTMPDVPVHSVLILDDILTTGTTLRAISYAVKSVVDLPVSLFTLAYTTYEDSLNQRINLQGHAYQWQKSQWLVAEEDQPAYQSLQHLKQKIQTDQW